MDLGQANSQRDSYGSVAIHFKCKAKRSTMQFILAGSERSRKCKVYVKHQLQHADAPERTERDSILHIHFQDKKT